jgi:hypothetical protein
MVGGRRLAHQPRNNDRYSTKGVRFTPVGYRCTKGTSSKEVGHSKLGAGSSQLGEE